MRTIKRTPNFKRDYKRCKAGQNRSALESVLPEIVLKLAQDLPLEPRYRDHGLLGRWRGYHECHVKPDLLLLYRKIGKDSLVLHRLASHSELELA
ncbi:MAG: type II toxin-antitoxin system YafQ family toxin [Candidatus Symbiobacter sp.]|nr:type II toxin-antitoxin system YafQ family toxin [Candidatus Symbiobacter sp.]